METYQIVGIRPTGTFWVDDLIYKNRKKAEERLNVLIEEEDILISGYINEIYVI